MRLWERVKAELKYQWHPFEGTVGCRDFAESDEREPPGYWRKGKYLTDIRFWVGIGEMMLVFRLPGWLQSRNVSPVTR
jgi:hypothetical protein